MAASVLNVKKKKKQQSFVKTNVVQNCCKPQFKKKKTRNIPTLNEIEIAKDCSEDKKTRKIKAES